MPKPTPIKLVAVLAGNMTQFRNWHEMLGLTDRAVYVSKPEQVLGKNFVGILKIGTWWDNPNWRDLEELILSRIQQS